jgi:hypothetical protein|tara:strand:+ start:782 stop:1471 length:690 start_codon:yes stop_codon:yes gene_type:complete
MQTNMINGKEETVGLLRRTINNLLMLVATMLGYQQPTATLVSKMKELDHLYTEYLGHCATDWIGFNPPSKRTQTLLRNKWMKTMNQLAKQIMKELVKIDCSYCGLGNVSESDKCSGRKVGSGFEVHEWQKSPKAPRVWVVDQEAHYNSEWIWVDETGHYEWGQLYLPAQGNCAIGHGPYEGSDRPMHNALAHLDSEAAQLVLKHLEYGEVPRRVRVALNELAEYETRTV